MIISWRKKFLFLHWPKTGGTSLTQALLHYGRWQDRYAYNKYRIAIARRLNAGDPTERDIQRITGAPTHAALATIENALGAEKIRSLSIITFCRNPFSWAWSYYRHIKRDPGHYLHHAGAMTDFSAFLRWLSEPERQSQVDHCRPADGSVSSPDFVGRFEALNEDATRLARDFSLPKLATISRLNIGDKNTPDYAALFKDERHRFVDAYSRDFEFFGYSTDPADAMSPPRLIAPTVRPPNEPSS